MRDGHGPRRPPTPVRYREALLPELFRAAPLRRSRSQRIAHPRRMQQTTAQTFAVDDASNVAEFGSAHEAGSSGGPFILNFGQVAEDQTEPMPNVLVGIYSIYLSDPSTDELAWIIGTSIINGELAAMFDAACQAAPRNCS